MPRTTPQPPTEPEAAPSIADDSAVAETEVDVSETPAAPVAKESAPQPPKKCVQRLLASATVLQIFPFVHVRGVQK